MKLYILIVFLLVSTLGYGQFGNNGQFRRNQQRMQMRQNETPKNVEFDAARYVGFINYDDIEKAAKKSSVKLLSDKGKEFEKLIKTYNKKMSELRRINSFTLKNAKDLVESFQKKAQQSGDYSKLKEVRETMTENLKPVAESIKIFDLEFDKKMRKILSEKQYKKWINYNRKKYKVFPTPE